MNATAPSGRAQPLWFLDHLVHIGVDGDASDGALALLDERGRRGDMPPLHVHRRDDETFYVLEGEMTLFVAGAEIGLRAGMAAFAPRDLPHTYRVESVEARWLVITTPAGFDAFVREVAAPAPAEELPPHGRTVDAAVLTQAAAKVGIEILGPPGALPSGVHS
jgi:mannose-6-phosphate isomerase-like protein (cupin superfamily)